MSFHGRVQPQLLGRLAALILLLLCNMPLIQALASSSDRGSNKIQKIAIIGGGISGLSCAQHLSNEAPTKLDVTVFDTGRLRPGGRLSSRMPGDPPKEGETLEYQYLSKCIIDHVAQILPLPEENDTIFQPFRQQLLQWESQGVVTRFPEKSLHNIVKDNRRQRGNDASKPFRLQPLGDDMPVVFHGTNGNGGIPLAMARKNANFRVVQDTWVSPSSGARYMTKSGQWKITASGQVLGYFDKLVIAHNGKCADRLMSKTPAKRVHRLLRVNFNAKAPKDGGKKMTLNSIYSLTFAIPADTDLPQTALPEPFVSGYIQNEPSLRFISCQSRKYPSADLATEKAEVWTVLSSAAFAKKHKAPQEFIPEEKAQNVTTLLLQGLERSLGLEHNSIRPLESRLQLWGAAVPLNTWQSSSSSASSSGFLYDPEFCVGVCGDWLFQPSVAGAWSSGRRLAEHILSDAATEVGLKDGAFVRSEGAHKGGIASLESSTTNKLVGVS